MEGNGGIMFSMQFSHLILLSELFSISIFVLSIIKNMYYGNLNPQQPENHALHGKMA